MHSGKKFIRSIRLRNFLSYGPESEEIQLESLNVLIGPNSSGKSNLLEAINLLRETPKDLTIPIREGGGISEWLWKGEKTPVAEIDVELEHPIKGTPLRHALRFTESGQRFHLTYELIEDVMSGVAGLVAAERYYLNKNGNITVGPSWLSSLPNESKECFDNLDVGQSVLSQRRDPQLYPEITYLAKQYSKILLYQEWSMGRKSPPRKPQPTDLPENFLDEDAGNLAIVVNNLQNQRNGWQLVLKHFKRLYPATDEITTRVSGNTVLLLLHEKGLKETIPATRWSDGMLRYLAILTMLCHPSPSPLICLEEPELGLHPDVLPIIAELLIEASGKTQIIVTTHSDVLVSSLTEVPESILVCERYKQGSRLQRLNKDKLKEWLNKYSLGELWRMGEIGGTL